MAEFKYSYTREIVSAGDHWDIGYGTEEEPEVSLVEEVFTEIGVRPIMRCNGAVCDLIFPEALTGPQETSVATVVADHKAAASI